MSDSCNPMKCSLPGSSVHGILQARIPEWVAISFSRGTSLPKNWTQVSRIAGRWFTDTGATQEAQTSPDILYNPCPSSRIRHFSKETRFLLLENGIGSQDLAAWYTIVWINTLFIHPSIYGYLGCFLEKAMAPHSSTLACRVPWMEEPGRLFTVRHWRRKWQPTPVYLPGESQGGGSLMAAVYEVAQSQTQLKWLS